MRWVDWYGDGSLWVLDVALACCTLEFDAAAAMRPESTAMRPESTALRSVPTALRSEPTVMRPEPLDELRTAPVEGRHTVMKRLPALDDRSQVVVVISGTVTDRLAPAVAAIVDGCEQQAGRRPVVISFGACASSGGPYWDSYAVTKGVDQLVGVDAYVPGCPPPPEALSAVLDEIAGRVRS
jgi:NADH-quinone oxidoreductase subunit B